LVEVDSSILGRIARIAQADNEVQPHLRYFPNDTIYAAGELISYLAYSWGPNDKRIYRKVDIERSEHLDFVISAATNGSTNDELFTKCLSEYGASVTATEVREFLRDLIADQVLCADHLVDITSADPLVHLLNSVSGAPALTSKLGALRDARDQLQGTRALKVPDDYEPMLGFMKAISLSKSEQKNSIKVDLFDNVEADRSTVSRSVVSEVEKVLNSLALVERRAGPLSRFMKRFSARFGDSEVPLPLVLNQLEALGYSDRDAAAPALARLVGKTSPKAGGGSFIDSVLDQALRSGLAGVEYLDIESQLTVARGKVTPLGTPQSTVVAWISLWRDEEKPTPVVEIRSVGTQDPGRVMGRFARGLPDIATYLKQSSETADVLDCEIVHLPEDKLGNICMRPVTAGHELRIRGGAASGAKAITLSDIRVSVVDDVVKLRCVSMDKFINLRMSNAHAFDKPANLSLYRFLNHVSLQGPATELPNLRRKVPNATFVPGLRANGVILSRPSWRIDRDIVDALRLLTSEARIARVAELRVELRLPLWIALVQGDNVIPYHLDTPWMVDDLVKNLLRGAGAMLTDVFPQGMRPTLGQSEAPHFHELQIALRTPTSMQRHIQPVAASFQDACSPIWDRWVFIALYVAPHNQDSVLLKLAANLEQLIKDDLADRFFFIRYHDDVGTHLRVRIYRDAGDALSMAIPALKETLAVLDSDQLLLATTVQPYVREVARYGGTDALAICEKMFCLDSRLILSYLTLSVPDSVHSWRSAALAIDAMLISFGLDKVHRKFAFAERAAREFDSEMGFDKKQRSRIGDIYRKTESLFVDGEIDQEVIGYELFVAAIPQLKSYWGEAEQVLRKTSMEADGRIYRIQWSVIHMRLNRMFHSDARLQEAIVWELLKRSYAKELFGNKSAIQLEESDHH